MHSSLSGTHSTSPAASASPASAAIGRCSGLVIGSFPNAMRGRNGSAFWFLDKEQQRCELRHRVASDVAQSGQFRVVVLHAVLQAIQMVERYFVRMVDLHSEHKVSDADHRKALRIHLRGCQSLASLKAAHILRHSSATRRSKVRSLPPFNTVSAPPTLPSECTSRLSIVHFS